MLIIDETDVSYDDIKNLEAVTVACLRSTPGAETIEAYVGGKLKLKFCLTGKGKAKRLSIHPNWGGRRPGAGRKPVEVGKILSGKVTVHVNQETYEFLQGLYREKGNFVRAAIKEKRERET